MLCPDGCFGVKRKTMNVSASAFRRLGLTTLTLLALLPTAWAETTASLRRFVGRDGKTFYAAVQSRTDTAVTFKMQNGATSTSRISDLSEPDQQFVRRWTKFKDELMNNAEFSKVTIKELLELRGYQSFEFDIRGNHIFVETEVNAKPMTLMVDTGAFSSVFHVEAAKAAGLEIGPMDQKIRGVAGDAPAAVTKVPSIKLGDVEVTNRKLLSADLSPAGINPDECGGILGADFLREMDAVISYREGRMFLKPNGAAASAEKKTEPKALSEFRRWNMVDGKSFVAALTDKNEKEAIFRFQGKAQPSPLPLDRLVPADLDAVKNWSKLKDDLAKQKEFTSLTVKELLELRSYQSFEYRLDGNHVLVDGFVGDTKATFLIDTGAYGGCLHLEFTKRAKLEMGPMDQKIQGIGGTAPAAITKVPLLKMGEAVIKDRELLTTDLFRSEDKNAPVKGNHDAIFGADFLRQLDAVINYKEGRMFLRPDNSDKADNADKADPNN